MNSNLQSHDRPDAEFGFECPTGSFSFFDLQGGLRAQWYPIAFSRSVKVNKPKRQMALGLPVLIWRTADDRVCGFLDICPHRQAPLSCGTANNDGITCPYHGWRFGSDGLCNQIPISPNNKLPRESVALTKVPLCEHGGMIWAWFGSQTPTNSPNALDGYSRSAGWRFACCERSFPFDLDDTIENFMDFAHTPIVHPGLIRGISSAVERGVTIDVSDDSVRAVHDPVDEKVGLLSGLIKPRGKLVQHSDTFLMPGNVKVEYWFGSDPPKFFAFLGMTPIAENNTLVLLTIGVQFGWLNPLIKAALPILIRRVLSQDQKIMDQQRKNLDLISARTSKSLQSDAVDSTVRALRSHTQDSTHPRPKPGSKRISVLI